MYECHECHQDYDQLVIVNDNQLGCPECGHPCDDCGFEQNR